MAKTLSENAHLPAGYDDKGSRWFVPEEARPYYGPVDKDQEHKVFDSSTREVGTGWNPNRHEYALFVLEQSGEAKEWAEKFREHRDDRYKLPTLREEYKRRVSSLVNTMTYDDEAWWIHHSLRLPAALSAHQYARAAVRVAERDRLRETCEVCGLHDVAEVSSYQVDAIPVVKDNTLRSPFLCRPCAALVPVVRADTLVNGHSRRELVAEWVARGTR
ncbi:hypothetical protein [Cellulosimicrobium sp. 22601]|uniref:hypothetical protein n=1 Tax=unclassified Cellulosimicrobium TaxID=2624466 RepID=UPI003F83D8B7